MQLWVGLGNPGTEHAGQRHNIGFMAVDAVADLYRFDPWKRQFQGWAAAGRVGGERLLLLKPATYMNDSGRAVAEAMRFFKLGLDTLTVFHDELDLAPLKMKLKTGGGAAGHNGLRSIDAHLGQDYRRVRLGIGHPGHKDRVTGHVLGNFAKTEADPLGELLDAIAAEAALLAAGEEVRFMNDVARRTGP